MILLLDFKSEQITAIATKKRLNITSTSVPMSLLYIRRVCVSVCEIEDFDAFVKNLRVFCRIGVAQMHDEYARQLYEHVLCVCVCVCCEIRIKSSNFV